MLYRFGWVLVLAFVATITPLIVFYTPAGDDIAGAKLSTSASSVARLRLQADVMWKNISPTYSPTHHWENSLTDEHEQPDVSPNSTNSVTENMTQTTTWEKRMEERFAERLATMKMACQKYKDEMLFSLSLTLEYHLFYSKKYNLMACVVSKAGATTWKTHLLSMHGVNSFEGNVHTVDNILAWYQMDKAGILRTMRRGSAATSVMTARHPLDRLVSAYRDKFDDGRPLPVDQVYVKVALKNLGRRGQEGVVSITFPEFITHVITQQRNKFPLDSHWTTYQRTCSSCVLHYDYILKTETLNEDLLYIAQKIGFTKIDSDLRRHVTNQNQSSYNHYYEQLNPSLLREIYNFYKIDFEMFGYEIPDFLKTFAKQ